VTDVTIGDMINRLKQLYEEYSKSQGNQQVTLEMLMEEIKKLEKEIEELKSRPPVIVIPYPYYYPVIPAVPYITYATNTTTAGTPLITVTSNL